MAELKIINRELFDVWVKLPEENKSSDMLLNYITEKYDLNDDQIALAKLKLNRYVIPKIRKDLKNVFYNVEKFRSIYSEWIEGYLVIPARRAMKTPKHFEDCSITTKKRRISNALKTVPDKKLVINYLNRSRDIDQLDECNEEMQSTGIDNTTFLFSDYESLGLLLDAKLSKRVSV